MSVTLYASIYICKVTFLLNHPLRVATYPNLARIGYFSITECCLVVESGATVLWEQYIYERIIEVPLREVGEVSVTRAEMDGSNKSNLPAKNILQTISSCLEESEIVFCVIGFLPLV